MININLYIHDICYHYSYCFWWERALQTQCLECFSFLTLQKTKQEISLEKCHNVISFDVNLYGVIPCMSLGTADGIWNLWNSRNHKRIKLFCWRDGKKSKQSETQTQYDKVQTKRRTRGCVENQDKHRECSDNLLAVFAKTSIAVTTAHT